MTSWWRSKESCRNDELYTTGGLLLKLILLPGLAVSLIVLAVVWLCRPDADVDALIDRLEREGDDRWLAALSLSALLHEPSGAVIKRDSEVAGRLSELLRQELEAGGLDRDRLNLRIYLCRALGEFQIADPLPVLLEAARLQRHAGEVEVRCAAIEAIALLVSHVGPSQLRSDPQLLSVLLKAAEDQQRPIRARAAFALGVLGGERAQGRLERMLADAHAEVCYNAATGLARHGNPKCVGVLREMLDPQRVNADRTTLQRNALRATGLLAAANPTADLGELIQAVERLTHSDVAAGVSAKAAELLQELEHRRRTPGRPRS